MTGESLIASNIIVNNLPTSDYHDKKNRHLNIYKKVVAFIYGFLADDHTRVQTGKLLRII